jgi:putative transposase
VTRQRKKHRSDEIVAKLRDTDAMLNAGKDLAAVLQALEVSDSTLERWRAQYGGMKCEEAKRLRHLEALTNRVINERQQPESLLSRMDQETGRTSQSERLPASRGRPAVACSRILDHEPKPAVGDEIPHA